MFALWPPGRCQSPVAFGESPKLSRLIQGGEGGTWERSGRIIQAEVLGKEGDKFLSYDFTS